MVSKLKRDELAKLIMEMSKTSWFEAIRHDDDEKALILVDEIINAGWVPIEDFPDEKLPETAQVVVNDVMERIISGLPERPVVIPHPSHEGIADVFPNGVKLVDVASLHPQEFVSDYYRIPDFDNYEINSAGEIRNRWTKRVLDVIPESGAEYVEMHDKDGFEHLVNVRYVREKVFGE